MEKTTCSVGECPGPAWARGWCDKHYRRWLKHGDPLAVLPRGWRGTPAELFWAKVDKDGPAPVHRPELGPCWIWTAARNDLGYGKFGTGGRCAGAHRVAYELAVGPIPDGLTLDHLCRNPPCVNPAHLEPVTQAENNRRAMAAITHCPAGHAYDEVNTRIVTGGYRQCRTCDRERTRAKRGWLGRIYGGTHCSQGHEYTPENTRIGSQGQRVCRTCVREYMRRRRAAIARG